MSALRVGPALAVIGICVLAGPASACIIGAAALVGIPSDGDSAVPTDVIPVYEDLPDASTLELVTESGEPVAFTVKEAYKSHFELALTAQLAPRTKHLLRATLPVSANTAPNQLTLSFTTGEGPLGVRPPTPQVRFQHYSGPDFPTLCGPGPKNSCLSFAIGSVLVLARLDSNGREEEPRYLLPGPAFWSVPGDDGASAPSCISLRARAENGALSDAVSVCGDQAESYELPDVSRIRCEANGLTIDGVQVANDEPSAGGVGNADDLGGSGDRSDSRDDPPGPHTIRAKGCSCELPGHDAGPQGAGWLLLVLSALRRRRASRRD